MSDTRMQLVEVAPGEFKVSGEVDAHSAESFGTAHLGSIKGTTFVVGVSGAAVGPLPFLHSPDAAYWIFLAATFCAAVLGVLSLRMSRVKT